MSKFFFFNYQVLCFSVIAQCIQQLVSDLEGACEPGLVAMAKVSPSFSLRIE